MVGEAIVEFIVEIVVRVVVEIIWHIVLNFIGGCIRWIYGTTWRTIANRPKFKFNEYINGPDNSNDWFDEKGHNFVNSLIGLIFVILLILSLIYFL